MISLFLALVLSAPDAFNAGPDASAFMAAGSYSLADYGQNLLVLTRGCAPCVKLMEELNANAFPAMRAKGWTIGMMPTDHLQIIYVDDNPAIAELLLDESFPLVVHIGKNGKITRKLKVGCGEPIDQWSIGWIYTAKNLRPHKPKHKLAKGVVYPTRGSWWTVDGYWPNEKQLRHHLLHGSKHAELRKFRAEINKMSFVELHSLHSDHHEGRVNWDALQIVAVAPTSRVVGIVFATNPIQTMFTQTRVLLRSKRGCPLGGCPR